MKLFRCLLPVALVLAGALSQGCKKETDPEYSSLTGALSLSMPAYVEPGYTKTFMIDTLMNVSRSDGGTVGYRFYDSYTGKYDTLVTASGQILKHHYTFTAGEKLDSHNLSLTAFVPDGVYYYSTSAYCTYTIVKPGVTPDSSITGFDVSMFSLTDPRDNKSYYIIKAGDRDWMRQNLAWEGAGRPFQLCSAMTDVFGRYYTWEEAQTACPPGWHLPSDADWTALKEGATAGRDIPALAGEVMGDLYFNGTKMWEYWRDVKITDKHKLSMIPVGYATVADKDYDFQGIYSYAAFWTSDESDGMGVCRYIYQDKDIVYRGRASKTDFAASVRCVR